MSSLADLPELIGFFSYSRQDDEDSSGGLSKLRERIYRELGMRLGRDRHDFRLWQDKAAIPYGTLWKDEIERAIAESVFFIPIISPRTIRSQHCRFEFASFLKREAALGRANLVFPILYIDVAGLEMDSIWRSDEVLRVIHDRQYVDWRDLRRQDVSSPDVAGQTEIFCKTIVEALRKPWIAPAQSSPTIEPEIAARTPQASNAEKEAGGLEPVSPEEKESQPEEKGEMAVDRTTRDDERTGPGQATAADPMMQVHSAATQNAQMPSVNAVAVDPSGGAQALEKTDAPASNREALMVIGFLGPVCLAIIYAPRLLQLYSAPQAVSLESLMDIIASLIIVGSWRWIWNGIDGEGYLWGVIASGAWLIITAGFALSDLRYYGAWVLVVSLVGLLGCTIGFFAARSENVSKSKV